jgi:hypothetical protein
MRPGIQTFLDAAGDAACYALDIIQIAERELGGEIDPVAALEDGIEHGYIRYDWDNPGADDAWFVDAPHRFLALLTGDEWTVSKEAADYRPRPGEHVVERWERQKTGTTTSHFRLPDWDSLRDSQTVKYGRLVSTRVFRKAP